MLRRNESTETGSRGGWPGLGPGRMGVSANRDRAPFHRDGSGLELKSGDGYLTM